MTTDEEAGRQRGIGLKGRGGTTLVGGTDEEEAAPIPAGEEKRGTRASWD